MLSDNKTEQPATSTERTEPKESINRINQSASQSVVFSRPYLSNVQAIGTVVVRLSSVTDALWLNGANRAYIAIDC